MKQNLTIKHGIVVGGLTPLTTIDYPGELAAVVFLQGCPWRCGYCQNSSLLPRTIDKLISWPNVIDFLSTRIGLLDAVVFSGGEPTLQTGLKQAMQQVKAMGFKVGLHSAGIYPERLKQLIPLLDWVGLDIKAPLADYPSITGSKSSGQRAWKSAKILLQGGIPHEFRTTVHPQLLSRKQLETLMQELTVIGAENYVIQGCVTKKCLNEELRGIQHQQSEIDFIKRYSKNFKTLAIRNIL